jgi:hypothetical protein
MMRRVAIVIGLVLAAVTTSTAQLSFEHQPNKDPYRNLFTPETERLRSAAAATLRVRLADVQRCVVYNMPVVPANPAVDPKIRIAPPNGVDHKIKTVAPPSCKPD